MPITFYKNYDRDFKKFLKLVKGKKKLLHRTEQNIPSRHCKQEQSRACQLKKKQQQQKPSNVSWHQQRRDGRGESGRNRNTNSFRVSLRGSFSSPFLQSARLQEG